MKCPRCGMEIKDGDLYCENCAMEIRIVPEFDPQIEQQIHESMQGVGDVIGEEADRQARELTEELERQEYRERRTVGRQKGGHRRRRRILLALAVCGGAAFLAFAVFRYAARQSESYLVGEAYRYSEDGDYEAALESIESAVRLTVEPSPSLLLLRAEYLQKSGRTEEALSALEDLVQEEGLSSEERMEAYGRLLGLYTLQERYEEAAGAIEACGDEQVRQAYAQYLISEPVFDKAAGDYEGELELTLSADCEGTIFYTIDGTTPTTRSALYQSPLRLSDGEYEIAAICVNHFGVVSEVVTRRYEVSPAQPDAPEVLTEEGTYSRPTYITVAEPEEGEIYYTTDGTEPTQDSNRYTGRIPMPVGASVFKFVCISESGAASEVVECHYQMNVTSSFSIEDGPNYILVELINAGEIVDVQGTIRSGSARYIYSYQGVRQIQGYGTFYIYSESLMDYMTGDTVVTGRRFAVNTKNGTVNLYDAAGNLQQFTG
ncbi:MAG: chitobiase/beta-hexosaminidase C-terminal domain-containing protein [Eubacteriales bacterium]|nr:chitobiase/beta-hexosaminidase C-terminal domain-containing protein [Eubacteriales bacterium]